MNPHPARRVARFALAGALAFALAACATRVSSPREAFQRVDTAPPASTASPFLRVESPPWRDGPLPTAQAAGRPALAAGRLGLYPATAFRLLPVGCEDCGASPAARWFLQDEVLAVPGDPSAPEPWLPSPVWLGAPETIDDARLAADGRSLEVGGQSLPLALPPANPLDRHQPDASTARFFSQRPLRVRGATQWINGTPRFVTRTLWPQDSRLEKHALRPEPLRRHELLSTLVSAQALEQASAFPARLLLDKTSSEGTWAGKPALAFVLSGAQGDDSGAHAGHLGVATGHFGPAGEWADWLLVNFYPHERSEKDITSATLPLDSYLLDVRSGQLYFRPAYMLVAVLRRPEAAQAIQRALHAHLLDFYCHRVEYDRSANNSTAMSIDPLRALGWRIPAAGPTSRSLAVLGAPVAAISQGSLSTGRDLYRAFSAETTRLLPRVAFEVMGHDLLYLAQAAGREKDLTAFEQQLADDVEAVLFVRLPQVPSTRPTGTYPVRSLLQYGTRALADPVDYPRVPGGGERRLPANVAASCENPAP